MKLYTFKGSTFTKLPATEPPYAVCLTMPERFFQEYPGGEDELHRILAEIGESDDDYWMQTISAVPVQDVAFAYLVFRGRVQYRLSILEYSAGSHTWPRADGGIRHFPGKKWVHLCGPVVRAPGEFLMRGFQGFRYSSFIF